MFALVSQTMVQIADSAVRLKDYCAGYTCLHANCNALRTLPKNGLP